MITGTNAPLRYLCLTHSLARGLHLDLAPPGTAAGNTAVTLANTLFEASGLSLTTIPDRPP